MKTILVTGAQGLLGSRLVPLLAQSHRVIAVARKPVSGGANIEPLAADLSDAVPAELLPDRLDAVVYLAQSKRFREFPEGAADMRQVNVDQPLALIEEARRRGATSFVYASTGSIYAPTDQTLTEDSPIAAAGFYAASKYSAELMLRPYEAAMSVVCLRFFFIYGPGQNAGMLIPRLVESVRDGRPVVLQGDDGLRFNPIHVADAAHATAAASGLRESAAINVAGPEEVSIRQVAEALGGALGSEPRYELSGGNAPRLVADIGLMTKLLGAPATRFGDSVGELV